MDWFLIDGIGPFFRGHHKKKVNWSKIPFLHLDTLPDEEWQEIGREMRCFAEGVKRQGYTAVSLDDVGHLAHHPLHEEEVRGRVARLREKMLPIIRMLAGEFGLEVYLTSDVLPLTPALEEVLDGEHAAMEDYFRGLVIGLLDDVPEIAGVILRIGESDGTDVKDLLRTRLHVRCADELNALLKDLLPGFAGRGKRLILRTWTVGAHAVGDLIWNPETLRRVLCGIRSDFLVVSMKPGESDFFRYLTLHLVFREAACRMVLEVQARREYEGAGMFPSFLGRECEQWAAELADCPHVMGVSVWCQTGGWHRFHRRPFLEEDGSDVWVLLNTAAVVAVFRDGLAARDGVAQVLGEDRADAAMRLLDAADQVIRDLWYVPGYARNVWFFRRVRIPPLFHVYWDTVFINPMVRSLLRHLVDDHEEDLRWAREACRRFPEMEAEALAAGLPVEDIRHMRDIGHILLLTRVYVFGPCDAAIKEELQAAKHAYKQRWEKSRRYRIRMDLDGFSPPDLLVGSVARFFLRPSSAYRLADRCFVVPLLGALYRTLRRCQPSSVPKFLRKSAMGVDVVLE